MVFLCGVYWQLTNQLNGTLPLPNDGLRLQGSQFVHMVAGFCKVFCHYLVVGVVSPLRAQILVKWQLRSWKHTKSRYFTATLYWVVKRKKWWDRWRRMSQDQRCDRKHETWPGEKRPPPLFRRVRTVHWAPLSEGITLSPGGPQFV